MAAWRRWGWKGRQSDVAVRVEGRLAGQQGVVGRTAAAAPRIRLEVSQRHLNPIDPDGDAGDGHQSAQY
jgi:hypothetical protein